MVLHETTQVLKQSQLYTNKLQNMKDQLEILLRKKIRLESEINILKKSIKSKSKSFEGKIKLSLKMESSEVMTETEQEYLLQEDFNLYQSLLEFDSITTEIDELLRRFDENPIEE